MFYLFVCGCVFFIKLARQTKSYELLYNLIVATLATWLLSLNFFGHSAWFFVFHLFPGAKALNAVTAYQIFLALPVIIIAVKYLSQQHAGLPLMMLISGILIAGEINKPYLDLDRRKELARIALPHLPPSQCRAFYVSGWKEDDSLGGFPEWFYNYYAHNVSAMLIAQCGYSNNKWHCILSAARLEFRLSQ